MISFNFLDGLIDLPLLPPGVKVEPHLLRPLVVLSSDDCQIIFNGFLLIVRLLPTVQKKG